MEMATQTMPGGAGAGSDLENTFRTIQKTGKDAGGGARKLSNAQLLAAQGVNTDDRIPKSRRRRSVLTRAQFDARVSKTMAAGKGELDMAALERETYVCSKYPQLRLTIVQGRSAGPDGRGVSAAAINVRFGGDDNPPGVYWTPDFDELMNEDVARQIDTMKEDDEERLMRMARRKAAQQILIIKEHLSPAGLLAWHPDYAGEITKFEKAQAPDRDDQSAAAIALLKEQGLLGDTDVASIVANLEKKRRGGIPDLTPPMQSSSLPTTLSRERVAPMRGKPGARRDAPAGTGEEAQHGQA